MARLFLIVASASGFLSVALGAFGAHGLKNVLDEKYLAIFQTGVHYQFFHTFALALVAVLLMRGDSGLLRGSGYAFVAGILIFSGSLYALALSRVGVLGAITPLGGLSFLVGWALLFVFALKVS
jgi:uncharacterized membrane protein YgdD (TMEM256/DUF423 family)